jgi:hypothetical protein
MGDLGKYFVRIPRWMFPPWWVVAYKIIPEVLYEKFGDLLEAKPDARFEEVVSGYLHGLVEKGQMPPQDVAPAIYNLANDFLNNRQMIIRTGDYITIQ